MFSIPKYHRRDAYMRPINQIQIYIKYIYDNNKTNNSKNITIYKNNI